MAWPIIIFSRQAAMPYKDAHCSALAWILSSIRSKGSRPRFPFSRWKTWELKASNGLTILFRISLHNYTTRRTEQLKCTILTMSLNSFWSMYDIFVFNRLQLGTNCFISQNCLIYTNVASISCEDKRWINLKIRMRLQKCFEHIVCHRVGRYAHYFASIPYFQLQM